MLRFIDKYLIKNSEKLPKKQLTLQRGLIWLILMGLFSLIIVWILDSLGIFNNELPFLFMFIYLCILLVINKFYNAPSLVVNLVLACYCGAIIYIVLHSGGIYSYNLRWFLIVIAAPMILRIKSAYASLIFWLGISLLTTFYIYFESTGAHHDTYLEQYLAFTVQDHLIDAILFFAVAFSTLIIAMRTQARLQTELESTNETLSKQKKELDIKTEDLVDLSEKLQETNKSLEAYAYTASHDLKQPISSIARFATLLKKELKSKEISDEASTYLDFIEEESTKSSDVIEKLLSKAKQSDLDMYDLDLVCMNALLDDVKTSISAMVAKNEAEIISTDLPEIMVDRTQIKRLFQNVITNAIKYKSKKRKPIINVNVSEKGAYFQFSVADNGRGIPQNMIEQIFNPFQQVSSAQNGQGLGLDICTKIVEQHGGKIWANSTVDEGSIFSFTLNRELEPF